jgi:hypothetical protein
MPRQGELRSPACLRITEGTRRAANRGRLLLVTFLAKTRKVTGCRATPDGFDFGFAPFDFGGTAAYAQGERIAHCKQQ